MSDLGALLAEARRAFTAGDLNTALQKSNAALAIAPRDVNALYLVATVKRAAGAPEEALAAYDAALAAAPQAAPIQLSRAGLLHELGRNEEALAGYDKAAVLGMQHPGLQFGRGAALFSLDRFGPALAAFDACIAMDPGDADAHYNRARSLQALDRLDDALAAYNIALTLKPNDADALQNRAVLLQWLNRPEDSLRDFDAALAQRPDDGPTLYSKGIALLAFGDYKRGWPLHEIRRRPGVLPSMRNHARGEPEWHGERLGGALRIWPEQGIGDEVLFARLTLMARQRTDKIILQCAPRLAPLFARSFADIEIRADDSVTPPPAAQIAAGSLGFALDIAASYLDGSPYLKADQTRRDAIRARYEALAEGRPIVGIAWISKNPLIGKHKSTSLHDWRALLARDYFFVNLQYGDVAEEIAAAERELGHVIYSDPEIDQLADIDGFAGQIAALDRIVSVSNTTVHLAGALGVPCVVLVPPAQGLLWYWGASGERTPWYDSVRIVRRAQREGWADHVAKAATHVCL
ncbi:MAG: tetratricopeptide repeat protein [Terricaulis silvestris]